MYAFLSMLMDGPASLATSFIGLKIAPHFDKPYLTCSLTDFWSRRWNLTAGNTLRFLVPPPLLPRLHALRLCCACQAVCSLAAPRRLACASLDEAQRRRSSPRRTLFLLWL